MRLDESPNPVTLWDARECALLCVLPPTSATAGRVHLEFVPRSPYLVAASRTGVAVYDVLTAVAAWQQQGSVAGLAVDTRAPFIALTPAGTGPASGASGRFQPAAVVQHACTGGLAEAWVVASSAKCAGLAFTRGVPQVRTRGCCTLRCPPPPHTPCTHARPCQHPPFSARLQAIPKHSPVLLLGSQSEFALQVPAAAGAHMWRWEARPAARVPGARITLAPTAKHATAAASRTQGHARPDWVAADSHQLQPTAQLCVAYLQKRLA